MDAVTELATAVGTCAACRALFAPRASLYRQRRASTGPAKRRPRPAPPRALAPAERETVLARLHEERFQDRSPAAVYATLLDEGQYHCSIRTMYRILEQEGEIARAPRSAHSSALSEARIAGHGAQPTLELGHHQAAGSGEVDVLLSLRDPRRLQPLRHRLDGGHARKRGTGQAAHRGNLCEAKHPAGPAHHPRRPRYVHDVQTRRLSDGRSGRHQDPQPPACLRRQSVFGKPVPHHEIPAGVPGPLRVHSRQPCVSRRVFSAGTTKSIATPDWRC